MQKTIEERLFFLTGLLCSMSYIGIQTSADSIFALYNIPLTLLSIILLMKSKGKIFLKKEAYPFYGLMMMFLMSTLINISYLDSSWLLASVKATAKFICVFGPLSLVIFKSGSYYMRERFLDGLKIAIVIQCTWGLMQEFLWFTLGMSLNGIVLGDILGIQPLTGTWSIITFTEQNEIFRVTGLSWEGANYSVLLVLGVLLFKNMALKMYMILGVILSTSRTGIMTLGIVLFFVSTKYLIYYISNKNLTISYKFIRKALVIVFSIFVLSIYIYNSPYYESIEYIFNGISSAFDYKNTSNASTSRHVLYYTDIDKVFGNISVAQILFGCGTFAAGYPYEKSFPELVGDGSVWNPESDIITLMLGNGLLGLLCYMFFLKNIYQVHDDYLTKGIIVTYLIAGVFYGQIRSWPIMLFLILLIDKKEITVQ